MGVRGAGGRSGGQGWGGFWETESDEWIPPCAPSIPPSLLPPIYPSPPSLLTPLLLCKAMSLVHYNTLWYTSKVCTTQRILEQDPNFGSSTSSSGVSRHPAVAPKPLIFKSEPTLGPIQLRAISTSDFIFPTIHFLTHLHHTWSNDGSLRNEDFVIQPSVFDGNYNIPGATWRTD